MSLKGFHLFFITFASLACLAFAAWALLGNTEGFGSSMKLFGILAAAGGVVLPCYGIWFVKKTAAKITA
ncbi:MAG: hypothetical protein KA004_10685 [Verrucomicrobiales bacterium]|nr:hypothetical protein [Verrucomicrobiales bacterium]